MIDYDRPVKGKLTWGYWWAYNENCNPGIIPPQAFKLVWVTDKQETVWEGRVSVVSEWRKYGWQFYRVRLPKPRVPVRRSK